MSKQSTMRASVSAEYGLPDVIRVMEVDKPVPLSNEILVRVYASSVNRTDDGFLRAKPAIVRLFSGLTKPKKTILGCEFAGKIESIGRDVEKFKVGDKVFGYDDTHFGGHAEYLAINEMYSIAKIPKGKSYEEMAVSTEGAHYALSYVRVIERLGAKRVLVHGATGAIGSAAVQLLKHEGMYVVATSMTKNMKLVKSLGADKVIDWEKEDFTDFPEQFDVVFDAVGKSSFRKCKKLLSSNGVYIATELGFMAQNPLLGIVSPIYKLLGARRSLFPLPKNNIEVIEFLRDRIANGEFSAVIDRSYPLDEIADAYRYVETGQKTGSVVIVIK